MISEYTNWLLNYLKQMPGFDKLNPNDLKRIINQKLFVIFGLLVTSLFLNNDLYLMLNEKIQFSKIRCNIVFGEVLSEKIFFYHFKLNELNLSDTEFSLLIPYLLSFDGK